MYFIEQMKNVGHYDGQPYPEEFEEDEQFYRFFKNMSMNLLEQMRLILVGLLQRL